MFSIVLCRLCSNRCLARRGMRAFANHQVKLHCACAVLPFDSAEQKSRHCSSAMEKPLALVAKLLGVTKNVSISLVLDGGYALHRSFLPEASVLSAVFKWSLILKNSTCL